MFCPLHHNSEPTGSLQLLGQRDHNKRSKLPMKTKPAVTLSQTRYQSPCVPPLAMGFNRCMCFGECSPRTAVEELVISQEQAFPQTSLLGPVTAQRPHRAAEGAARSPVGTERRG